MELSTLAVLFLERLSYVAAGVLVSAICKWLDERRK